MGTGRYMGTGPGHQKEKPYLKHPGSCQSIITWYTKSTLYPIKVRRDVSEALGICVTQFGKISIYH